METLGLFSFRFTNFVLYFNKHSMETLEHKTFTFREVHAELEMENSLLLKEHNIEDFSKKSKFLNQIGFANSKATKMYQAIVESEDYRKEFNRRYFGMHKFILKEQLERVCEKYNLFVRDLKFFAGDIPEKNIKDMMDFKVAIDDLVYFPDWIIQRAMTKNLKELRDGLDKSQVDNLIFHNNIMVKDLTHQTLIDLSIKRRPEIENLIKSTIGINFNQKIPLNEVQITINKIFNKIVNHLFDGNKSTLKDMRRLSGLSGRDDSWLANIEIAAVKSLFTDDAFRNDTSRLGNQQNELLATGQVDLDPIVMIKNHRGYIIITAWGDEANDELIVNQQLN